MPKPQIVLLSYDKTEKIIELETVEGEVVRRGIRKGMTVDEFKKLIRSKYGDKIIIVNKISKERSFDVPTYDKKEEDDRFNLKDIHEAMRNEDMMNKKGLPKVWAWIPATK